MAKKEFAIYLRKGRVRQDDGKWKDVVVDERRVRVMARAEGYAMVRNPGCMPFVVSEKELVPASQ